MATLAPLGAMLRDQLDTLYGARLAASCMETLRFGSESDRDALLVWLDGRRDYDPDYVVTPIRGDSATRAGTLRLGALAEWRGVPSGRSSGGVVLVTPGNGYYGPGDGYALARESEAERAEANAKARETAVAARAVAGERRGETVGSVGYVAPSGTYCGGYAPPRPRKGKRKGKLR